MPLMPSYVLYPPPHPEDDGSPAIADLDWATGLTRFFISQAEHRRILDSDISLLPDEERYIFEALTHESAHLLQLALTGFGYDFSSRFVKVVISAAARHSALDDIYLNRQDYADDLSPLFASLQREGPRDITPITIMESAAFLAQKASHYEGLGPRSYAKLLDDEAPSGEYRLAYDIAFEYLGPDALDHFPHIANLALATSEPETVFIPLLEEFQQKASRLDIEHNHRLGLTLLNGKYRHILLGSGVDRIEAGQSHPVLDRIVAQYNHLANQGQLRPITLFARGRAYDDATASLLAAPTFFPPSEATGGKAPIWVPNLWATGVGKDALLQPEGLRWLFVTSMLLQQDFEDPEPSPLVPPETSADSPEVVNIPATIREMVVTRENRTAATADHFSQVLADIGRDRYKARILRGTLTITFPGEEFSDLESPFMDESVQSFLRRFFGGTPYVLYFLSDLPESAALLEVAAAFFPEDLRLSDDGVGLLLSPEFLQVLAQMLRNAAEFAVEQGQPRQVVLTHLKQLPDELRDALADAVLS